MNRGQSHVVGVALMLGLTVAAIGTLTVGIGTLLDAQAATADATRVGDGFARSLQPQRTTGHVSGAVRVTQGRLHTVDRQLTIRRNGSTVGRYDVGGLVFTAADRRVAYVAGAIVRGTGKNTWLRRDPPVTVSRDGAVAVIGVVRLEAADVAVAGDLGRVRLDTTVSHRRNALGPGTYSIAIESAVPSAFEPYFRARNATVTRRDFDGDGLESVVAIYRDVDRAYVVHHELGLEIGDG